MTLTARRSPLRSDKSRRARSRRVGATTPGKAISKISKITLVACGFLIAAPVFPRDKKTSGEIPNPRALAKVESYCVDTEKLSDWDRRIVDDFLKTESRPRHLLTRLPWKLVKTCREGNPDATATLEFVPLNFIQASNQPTMRPVIGAQDPDAPIKVVLTVGDAETLELLYRIQSPPVEGPAQAGPYSGEPEGPINPADKRAAVYDVFWALIEDLRTARASQSK